MPFAQRIIARCQKIPPIRQYACSQLLALSDHAPCPGARPAAGPPWTRLVPRRFRHQAASACPPQNRVRESVGWTPGQVDGGLSGIDRASILIPHDDVAGLSSNSHLGRANFYSVFMDLDGFFRTFSRRMADTRPDEQEGEKHAGCGDDRAHPDRDGRLAGAVALSIASLDAREGPSWKVDCC